MKMEDRAAKWFLALYLSSSILRLLFSALLAVLATVVSTACDNQQSPDEQATLRVDGETVSLEQFRNRYELDPAFPGVKHGVAGLREYAETLADEILSLKLARREGVVEEPRFQRYLSYCRQRAMVQALYRQEVADQIEISETELRAAYRKSLHVLHVRHLFAATKKQARDLYLKLQQGVPFDSLAQDVFVHVSPSSGGADLGEVRFGDLTPELEQAAFQLAAGAYSRPVRSRWGYHILQVVEGEQQLMPTESDYLARRSKLLQKLKQRKEEALATRFVKQLMQPRRVVVKGEAFARIVRTLGLDKESESRTFVTRLAPFRDAHVDLLRQEFSGAMQEPFMQSRAESWTLGQFLDRLESLPLHERPQIHSAARLREDIGVMIRNAFLADEARTRGLHHSAFVDSTCQARMRELAYQYYLAKAYEDFDIPAEVKTYYERGSSAGGSVPASVLPRLSNLETYRLYYAGRQLHTRLRQEFSDVDIEVNMALLQSESEAINWRTPVRMFVREF